MVYLWESQGDESEFGVSVGYLVEGVAVSELQVVEGEVAFAGGVGKTYLTALVISHKK